MLVERHLQQEGDWPRAMALTAWGTSNMRTGGDDIAQGLALMGGPIDTPFPVPHNVAVSRNGRRVAVTHSGGTADKLSLYFVDKGAPSLMTTATVGLNPFGIAYVP